MDLTSWTELGLAQLIGWSITGLILAAAAAVTFSGQHRNPRQDSHLTWWLWHWFTGGHLESGRSPRYEGSHRLSRRAGLAAVRTASTAGLVVVVYLDSGAPNGTGVTTLAAWGLGTTFGLAAFAVVVACVAVKVAHYLRWVYPLHLAVCLAAGWGKSSGDGKELERAMSVRAWRYITVRRDLERGGDGVVVGCSPTFAPRNANKEAVEEIIRAKLELSGDVTHRWEMKGRHHYVRFWPKDPIREVAPFNDEEDDEMQKLVEGESTPSTFVLGVTRGDRPYKVNLDRESPHVLMSAGTGGGKSTMLTLVAAQLMWHGAEPWVADYKRHSLRWLRDLPGVRYARDIGEIHRMLIELAAEGDRRNRAWDHVGINDEGPDFGRIVLILEELSTTAGLLRDHWTDIRGPGDPATSPAIRALTAILNMGRAVKINVLAVAQRASANAVGSGDLRENFSVRILAEHTPQTWKMLTSADFVPKSKIKGRVQVCVGDNATEVQVIRMSEEEAQQWVADRRGMQPMTAVPHRGENVSPGETMRERPPSGTDLLPGGVPAVTLWEASKDNGRGVVDLNFEALKKAAQRDRKKGEFPEPVGQRGRFPEYDPRDLQRWEPNRVRPKQDVNTTSTYVDQGNETDGVGRVDDNENDESEEKVPLGGWLQPGESPRDRFYARVADRDEAGCELWTGAVNGDGYGYFKIGGRAVPVHRFAFEDQVGPIPEGETVDHRIGPGEPCTSKLCTRGEHLQAVTNEKNVSLRHERDRAQQGATS